MDEQEQKPVKQVEEHSSSDIPSAEERNWAMACHLSAFTGILVPFGFILAPLIIWLVKKDTMPLVAKHGVESVNFQITFLLIYVVCTVLLFVLIGFVLLPIAMLVHAIFIIMASIKVSNGEDYRYPFAIRLIS
ncbi:DUF4870 domain-containing protein [Zooshikella marina]|uniref:DUF4870 domain-containing protein n=1 Tax=Zooshikella ganghwensis TaxID=202772 RepID=A0A4P9VPQ4_9GAMM|nr:DUF4870 domain-containing protein [Zooshikella ganghwensis]MBU2705352.1 DUF4870 domain-containing protein [Zooshikella ganghwensis]RDH44497.1 DUF4870 domain-containing protein [Zooshikella ganghwensis]